MKRILRLEDSAQRKLMVESIRAKSEEIQEESLKGAIAANEQEKKDQATPIQKTNIFEEILDPIISSPYFATFLFWI